MAEHCPKLRFGDDNDRCQKDLLGNLIASEEIACVFCRVSIGLSRPYGTCRGVYVHPSVLRRPKLVAIAVVGNFQVAAALDGMLSLV